MAVLLLVRVAAVSWSRPEGGRAGAHQAGGAAAFSNSCDG
jgi:hypothetical protein